MSPENRLIDYYVSQASVDENAAFEKFKKSVTPTQLKQIKIFLKNKNNENLVINMFNDPYFQKLLKTKKKPKQILDTYLERIKNQEESNFSYLYNRIGLRMDNSFHALQSNYIMLLILIGIIAGAEVLLGLIFSKTIVIALMTLLVGWVGYKLFKVIQNILKLNNSPQWEVLDKFGKPYV